MRPLPFAVLAVAGVVIAACSSGGQVSATFSSNVGGAGGAVGTGASAPAGPSSSSAQASSAASTAQASSAASSAQASSASSSTGGMGLGCGAANGCAGAEQLTDVNGDTGDDIRTVSGGTPRWFKLLVHDVVPTFGNNNESYTATLTSPPGLQFDLFAYDGTGAAPDCFAAPLQGSGNPTKVLSDAWPDSNGNDDRWILFEVRYVSGAACDGSATWTLKVEGHTGG